MRIAMVTESFLPDINGVSNSVVRVAEYLTAHGHQVLILAPHVDGMPDELNGARVQGLTCTPMPGYPAVRIVSTPRVLLEWYLADFAPDVVHLASPINVGYRAAIAARNLGLPSVALYQTELPTYAARYGFAGVEAILWQRVKRLHSMATLTLAPSSAVERRLAELAVPRVHRWGRGVDSRLFDPAKRSDDWRAQVAGGRKIIGYVGRLAPEKQVQDLAAVADLPGTQLVIVGDGPARPELERTLPGAHFTGALRGEELARALASFDLFVHPGELETFGQTLQEAMASGVPVVAVGAGGPLDIVDPSRTGWLYEPGNLADLHARVVDLIDDDRKRRAFADAARRAMLARSWDALNARLVSYYRSAIDTVREEAWDQRGEEPDEILWRARAGVGLGAQSLQAGAEQRRLVRRLA